MKGREIEIVREGNSERERDKERGKKIRKHRGIKRGREREADGE